LPKSGRHIFPLLVTCALGPGCKEDRCERDLARVESCDRAYRVDMCETAASRCGVHCDAKLDCSEFEAIDRGSYPEWWSRCWSKCHERVSCADGETIPASFACDGSEDCADGSDEQGCTYHVCASGQRVVEQAACDGYAHCSDGSDEEGCT
jgi:hypothetical protein